MLDEKTQLVFVYGTLLKGLPNNGYLSLSQFFSKARTKEEYRMYVDQKLMPFVSRQGDPEHKPCQIHGELYTMAYGVMVHILDQLEMHPTWYTRELVPIVLPDDKEALAWLYFNDRYMKSYTHVADGDYANYFRYNFKPYEYVAPTGGRRPKKWGTAS